MQKNDYLGKKYGSLVCVEPVGKEFLFRCDCGGERTASIGDVTKVFKKGGVPRCRQNCPLRVNPQHKHGESKTRFYGIWAAMRKRCENPCDPAYHYYGGRGIKVCERWSSFEAFRDDMKATYKPSLTLERVDNNGNYCPENCVWADRKTQAANRRTNHYVEVDGEKVHVAELARRVGINEASMRERIEKGKNVLEPPKRAKVYDTLLGPMTIAEMAKHVGIPPRAMRQRIYTYKMPREQWLKPKRERRSQPTTS